jgi:hypothetical protein
MQTECKIKELKSIAAEELGCGADVCQGPQVNGSTGLHERAEVNGNLRWGKLIEAAFIPAGLELPFFDRVVDDEAGDTVDQGGNDSQLGNNCRAAKGSDPGSAKNGDVFFERTVGSLGSRSQGMQLTVALGASGDFENETGMLGNGNMSGIAKSIGSMRTVPVKLEVGRKAGFDALLKT